MSHLRVLFILFFGQLLALCLLANTDTRQWHLADGSVFTAELVNYDVEAGVVWMKFNDRPTNKRYEFDAFGAVDQAWLVEWTEFADDLSVLLDEVGGEMMHMQTEGKHPTDVYVYYPSSRKGAMDLRPALLLFNAGGKADRYLMRHIQAGEAADFVLISLGSFRNNKGGPLENGFTERFEEILPIIVDRVDFDPNRLFLGGNSGGAWRAFEYSHRFDWPWAGIYSNGGHLGYHYDAFYDNPPKYPAGMRVAMVNGNNDFNNKVIEGSSRALQSRDCKVAVFSFEGGHQVPPPSAQLKAFNWMLEQEDFIEE